MVDSPWAPDVFLIVCVCVCVRVCACARVRAGDAALRVETPRGRPEGRVSDPLLYLQPLAHSGICYCEFSGCVLGLVDLSLCVVVILIVCVCVCVRVRVPRSCAVWTSRAYCPGPTPAPRRFCSSVAAWSLPTTARKTSGTTCQSTPTAAWSRMTR